MKNRSIVDDLTIESEIGAGGYGVVAQARWHKRHKDVAIKFSAQSPTLKREHTIFKRIAARAPEVTPEVFALHELDEGSFLIMELLKCNVLEFVKNTRLSQADILSLGWQMLDRIRICHEAGYLHRDIKPQNFMIRQKEDRDQPIVCLIDYGLSVKYLDSNGQHKRGKAPKFSGTAQYASSWSLRTEYLGRRDDLESWVYCMMKLFMGELPWFNRRKDTPNPREALVQQRELAISNREAFRRIPKVIEDIFNAIRELHHLECPPYDEYLRMIEKEMNEEMDLPKPVPLHIPIFSPKSSCSHNSGASISDDIHHIGADSSIPMTHPTTCRRNKKRRRSLVDRILLLCS